MEEQSSQQGSRENTGDQKTSTDGGQQQAEASSGEQQPASGQTQDMSQSQEGGVDMKDVEENRAITYLSYLGLLFLVPMLVKKDSKFAQFHAKQGLVLTVACFIGSFLIPVFGLGLLIYLGVLILSIMGLLSVNNGEMKELPLVGDLAKKINI